MVTKTELVHLKCPGCGFVCDFADWDGKLVRGPDCPKCLKIAGKKVSMIQVSPDGVVAGDLEDTPVLSGKDLNVVMYLLLGKVGTIEIPQEVFDTAPGPEELAIERQWDGTNKIWRFFIKKKPKNRKRKPKLVLSN